MPKFRINISIDNAKEHDRIWGWPYVSAHRGLRQVLFMWGWLYVEAKLVRG